MANKDGGSVNSGLRPEGKVVNEFHSNDDVDKDSNAHHHTLGSGSNQSSPGAHRHDGTDSIPLLEGYELSGSIASGGATISILNALVQLGATNNTTA